MAAVDLYYVFSGLNEQVYQVLQQYTKQTAIADSAGLFIDRHLRCSFRDMSEPTVYTLTMIFIQIVVYNTPLHQRKTL